MAGSHADIVRRFYEAWSDGQLPGLEEHLDPEVEYVNPEGAVEPGTRRGIDEFTGAVRKTYEAWEYWRAEPEELREVGDSVVAVVRYRTKGRGSGVEIEGRESALWTFREGKVVRYAWFHGVGDAAAAADQPGGEPGPTHSR
jgi:ketosteroid isomerase-like protein